MPVNSTQNSSIYGWTGDYWDRVQITSSGHLKCNIANNTDPATATKQEEGNTLLTDIKTNTTQEAGAFSYSKALPVILTTYEGGSSLNAVGSQSGNVKVYIDDANPDFVANSGMATGAKQDAGNAHLSTLAGAVSGSEMQVDIVSGSVSVSNQPADPATGSKQDAQLTQLSTLAGAVSGTEMQVDIVSSASTLNVQQFDVVNKGAENNIASNETITAGSQGIGNADVSDMKDSFIIYEDSATSSFDAVEVLVSGNSGSNYHAVAQIYPANNPAGTKRVGYLQLNLGGLTNLAIQNASSVDTYSNVYCMVYGSP